MRQCVDGMNDQLSIFPKTGQELGREREKDFFESMLPDLREAVKSVNAYPEDITYKKCIGYSSLNFRSSNICRLKLRGKKWYISIPITLKESIPNTVKTSGIASEPQFLRIHFSQLSKDEIVHLLKEAALLSVEKVSKEFDEVIAEKKKEKKKYIPPMTHPWKVSSFQRQIEMSHTSHQYA